MDAVTSATVPACPSCGSQKPQILHREAKGEVFLCPECHYPMSSWRLSG